MTLLGDLERLFGSEDLYTVLGVEKTSSSSAIRKAYYKLAQVHHPDKVTDEAKREESKEKFQALSAAYAVLSEEDRRKLYDETGQVSDEEWFQKPDNVTWMNYWRAMYKEVTAQDIIDYEKSYKNSKQEETDIKDAYITHKGNMTKIFCTVPLSDPLKDEERFRTIIDKLIETKEVKSYKQYSAESTTERQKRLAAAKREAKLAEAENKKRKASPSSDLSLIEMITQKNKQKSSSFDALLEKYAGGGGSTNGSKKKKKKKKGSGKDPADISDEEFERIQKKLLKGKKSKIIR